MNAYATFAIAMSEGSVKLKDAIPMFSREWQACVIMINNQLFDHAIQGLTPDQKSQWKLYSKGLAQRPQLPPRASSASPAPALQSPWSRAVHHALKNDEARGCNPDGESEWYQHLTSKQLPDRLYDEGPNTWRGPYGESADLLRMFEKNDKAAKMLQLSADVDRDVGGMTAASSVTAASGNGGSLPPAVLTTSGTVMTAEASLNSKGTYASSSVEGGIPGTQQYRRGRGRGRMVQSFGQK